MISYSRDNFVAVAVLAASMSFSWTLRVFSMILGLILTDSFPEVACFSDYTIIAIRKLLLANTLIILSTSYSIRR